jgi:hypothetical protein
MSNFYFATTAVHSQKGEQFYKIVTINMSHFKKARMQTGQAPSMLVLSEQLAPPAKSAQINSLQI